MSIRVVYDDAFFVAVVACHVNLFIGVFVCEQAKQMVHVYR